MKKLLISAIMLTMATTAMADNTTIKVLQTTDVHGHFFPYDFISRKEDKGSLARTATYIKKIREEYGDNVLLLDNGDILQGQPVCYYFNYVNTKAENVAASVINYLRYDAETMGNHDVETGHSVYDKWISEVGCPMLGANIIDTATGSPWLKPYAVFTRSGVKIAVLGMITPAIPNWLNEELWSGLRFEEMTGCARRWVNIIKEKEQPDVIIGLLHSGKDGGIKTEDYDEDAALRVAREVAGFDIVMFGHDHTKYEGWVRNEAGDSVLLLNPSCYAVNIAEATITIENGKKLIDGRIVGTTDQPIDEDYVAHFKPQIDSTMQFIGKQIGVFEQTVSSRDCFFGSAPFTDLIHQMQLQLTGADISITAPLSFNARIKQGPVYVSDMFNLYKYENKLYTVMLSGEELRKHLEMSYDLWGNTMTSPADHALRITTRTTGDQQRVGFENLLFNFDSAAGIDYEVDLTKPDGQKVKILRMSNGKKFNPKKIYKVAMNSYRANGGGELLTRGAGISKDSLESRIVWQSEKDLRFYLMKEIERQGTVNPKALNNWRFVPEKWTKEALRRDREQLFGKR